MVQEESSMEVDGALEKPHITMEVGEAKDAHQQVGANPLHSRVVYHTPATESFTAVSSAQPRNQESQVREEG